MGPDEANRELSSSRSRWIVVRFDSKVTTHPRYYVLSRSEMYDFLNSLSGRQRTRSLWLSLTTNPVIKEANILQAGETFVRDHSYPFRMVRLGFDLRPIAVAGLGSLERLDENNLPHGARWYPTDSVGSLSKGSWSKSRGSHVRDVMPEGDEGSTPVRYPAIGSETPCVPGQTVVFSVDLRHAPDDATMGNGMDFSPQMQTWSELPIGVTLVSADIDFSDDGRGTVLVRRNQSSVPARIRGTLKARLKANDIVDVHAQFWDGTRCTGSAVRTFITSSEHNHLPTRGALSVPLHARKPDLTVFISLFDASAPGKMRWILVTEPFDGLPAKLSGNIDLGQSPRDEANRLFSEFANLARGEHTSVIEGFGERLWEKSPDEFKKAYWALHEHYGRPLTIQFSSDDPHLPWELMKPTSEEVTHPPLAQYHAVARWIGAYQGLLRNTLPAGDLVIVAPRYKSLATARPKTEDAAAALQRQYGAIEVPGTREALIDLLERPPDKPVALLYFTGHGKFDEKTPYMSAIKLEDRKQLMASEVRRMAVKLGEKFGTVIFFNSCEVGATAAAFGEVGGWADAFLARRFRAFIAPLWAVDEEDAAIVSEELIAKLVRDRMSIGTALKEIRESHGKTSPTFHSYLVYGDVTACFDAGFSSLPPNLIKDRS